LQPKERKKLRFEVSQFRFQTVGVSLYMEKRFPKMGSAFLICTQLNF